MSEFTKEELEALSVIYNEIMDKLEEVEPNDAVHILGICLANISVNTESKEGTPATLEDVISEARLSAEQTLSSLEVERAANSFFAKKNIN